MSVSEFFEEKKQHLHKVALCNKHIGTACILNKYGLPTYLIYDAFNSLLKGKMYVLLFFFIDS